MTSNTEKRKKKSLQKDTDEVISTMHTLSPASLPLVFKMPFGLEPGGDHSMETSEGADPTLV